jgi:hypothetical protein
LKTQKTAQDPELFLQNVADDQRRADCLAVAEMMSSITRSPAKMWGPSIVGFGNVTIKYESGRELEWMLCGFSPRKSDLTIYLMGGYENFPELMSKLGKYKLGKSCLYIKKLSEIDQPTLRKLIATMVEQLAENPRA